MKHILLGFLIVLTFVCPALSQTVKIGLLSHNEVNSLSISVREGKYQIIGDGEIFGEYKKKSIFFINRLGDKIEIRDRKIQIGVFSSILLKECDTKGIITLRTVNPIGESTDYPDGIRLEVKNSKLIMTNLVDMEKYIAGVIESEGGTQASKEYYKAQAVLVRTYAIKEMYKHGEETFNLCDGVHCQAYHGTSTSNALIYEATLATEGQVLIDVDSVLIMSPFHANCGGNTCQSGMYWQKDLSYLQTVKDPFCRNTGHSDWKVATNKTDWQTFIKSKNVSELFQSDIQVNTRMKYVPNTNNKISFRDIREKWGLKSPYFSIHENGNTIEFIGKGYGHGVGMCQEGAMEMAKVGFNYLDILYFYFQNVILTDYREMELHRF